MYQVFVLLNNKMYLFHLIFVCLNLCREQLKLERQYSQNERNIEEKIKNLNLFLENALQ